MHDKVYSTYIMSNYTNSVLYIGVTGNLVDRVYKHKIKHNPKSFTAKYNVYKLVYYESFATPNEAIRREKQLKNWKREWKIDLIKKENQEFRDLSENWYDTEFEQDRE